MFEENQDPCTQVAVQPTQGVSSVDLGCPNVNGDDFSKAKQLQANLFPLRPCSSVIPPLIPLKSTAELLVECLENEGVRYVFGSSWEEDSLIKRALHQSPKIQYVPTHHARGATSMAQVISRLTNQTGVCFARAMQNSLDFLPGVVDANLNSIPLVAITEQAISGSLPFDSRASLDLVDIFAPGAKLSQQIDSPARTPEIIHNAFHQAQTVTEVGHSGVVHLNLPATTTEKLTSGAPLSPSVCGKTVPDLQKFADAAEWINRVHEPLILVGSDAVRANVREELITFATQLEIPVVSTVIAKGLFPETHPLSLGTLDSSQANSHFGFDWAGLVITVGLNATECSPQYWNPDGDIPVLHMGQASAELNLNYQPQVELVGDLSDLLGGLAALSNRQDKPASYLFELCTLRQAEHKQDANDTTIPFTPLALIRALRTVLQPEDILFSDAGGHREWIIRNYHCELPKTCFPFHGFSSTGLALSGAIAAKLVHPDRNVIAVTGVEGFMDSYSELAPAQWLKTPFVTLICNQGGCYPDWIEVAKSLGFKGYYVTASDDLIPTLKAALAQAVPVIIDCPVDYRENSV